MNQTPSIVSQADQARPAKPDAATRWRKLLEDQRVSGLPVTAFCRERGIAASSLFAWRGKLSGQGLALRMRGGEETFKPVTIVTAPARGFPKRRRRVNDDDGGGACRAAIEMPAASFIELRLRGDRRLMVRRGFDRQLLAEVIGTLEGLPSRLESLP